MPEGAGGFFAMTRKKIVERVKWGGACWCSIYPISTEEGAGEAIQGGAMRPG